MKYLEAISDISNTEHPAVFLAGGIQNCRDWQTDAAQMLQDYSWLRGTILNPRRKDFPIHDPSAARAQITWEFNALKAADVILFWFSHETLQPIVLYELGRWAAQKKPIVVGVDPNYPRRQDVEIQLELAIPGYRTFSTLSETVEQAIRLIQ